ncbi:hypothetical protein D3C80_1763930 [compost metagenome]
MAAVQLGRQPGLLQYRPQQRDDTVWVQSLLAEVPPAVDSAEHWPASGAGQADPVAVGLHRAEPGQRWRLVGLALVVAIALAPGQEQLHALPRAHLDVLHLQAAELVTAEGAPETDQQQRAIAPTAQ